MMDESADKRCMDQTDNSKRIEAALGLTKKIVCIKLFRTAEEYACFPAASSKHKLSYCMMVRMAAYGKTLKAEDRHFKCNGSRRALGLTPVDDYFASGRHYHGMGLYQSKGKAKKAAGNMAFVDGPVHGVAVYPLEESFAKSDVILIICTPYQAMRITVLVDTIVLHRMLT